MYRDTKRVIEKEIICCQQEELNQIVDFPKSYNFPDNNSSKTMKLIAEKKILLDIEYQKEIDPEKF